MTQRRFAANGDLRAAQGLSSSAPQAAQQDELDSLITALLDQVARVPLAAHSAIGQSWQHVDAARCQTPGCAAATLRGDALRFSVVLGRGRTGGCSDPVGNLGYFSYATCDAAGPIVEPL